MPAPDVITPAQLARRIGLPDAPVILDLRLPEDAARDPRRLPAALARRHLDIPAWAPGLAGREAVVLCQVGRKISQGAAAWLRVLGVRAEALEGGFAAWAAAGLPLLAAGAPARGTTWVTRHRPKVDRIACPWLIRRFLDPEAVFLFVAPAEVAAVADRFGATAFDTEDAPWTHQGEGCTFDHMLAGFGLAGHAPLDRLARIVRGADTAQPGLEPEAAGLLAISLGLSRMHREDLAQLDAAMPVYDALFRWCRDATGETHDWVAGRAA